MLDCLPKPPIDSRSGEIVGKSPGSRLLPILCKSAIKVVETEFLGEKEVEAYNPSSFS